LAINGLSIRIEPGVITGLLGPNGSGKTTMFNLITGIYSSDSGSIRFMGNDITNQPSHRVSLKGIGRTFQATRLFFNQSVAENIAIAMIAQSRDKKREEKIDRVLEFTSLTGFKNTKANELSHAAQRRLMVAMALVKDPSLLLLDEITSGMSGEECNGIMAMIKKIKENGTTIIMIEHNMRVAMTLCDRVIVISFGEKIAEGTPKEVSSDKRVLDAYLGKEEY
jgi:branched-chain amino acid transport system ATP-binding protein